MLLPILLPMAILLGAAGLRAEDPESVEQRLLDDLLACARGGEVSDLWRTPRLVDGHLRGGGRSANHGRMARAIQTCVAPEEKVGSSELTARQWWTEIEELERTTYGHRYQELAGGYEAWSGLAEAVVVWKTGDPDHPAARMLSRELLLFAIGAREIEHRSKWRALYRGYGRRVAGLRKLPWAWSYNTDSFFYAQVLDLPVSVDILPEKTQYLLAAEVAPRVSDVLGERLSLLRTLVLEPASARDSVEELRRRARPLRAAQPYLLVRQVGSSDVFSALLGPLAGRNTAPTRAVLVRGPRMSDTEIAYPFRRGDGEARRRVRGHDDLSAGGGRLERGAEGTVYRTWNGAAAKDDEGLAAESSQSLPVPHWVPVTPGEHPCGTLGIWLFPDRPPQLWLVPDCFEDGADVGG